MALITAECWEEKFDRKKQDKKVMQCMVLLALSLYNEVVLKEMFTKQGFYPNIHMLEDLTASVLQFPFSSFCFQLPDLVVSH